MDEELEIPRAEPEIGIYKDTVRRMWEKVFEREAEEIMETIREAAKGRG